MHHESMSTIVRQMRPYTVLLYFLQTALHVSDDPLIHQKRTQTVITTSGTGRTIFATVR